MTLRIKAAISLCACLIGVLHARAAGPFPMFAATDSGLYRRTADSEDWRRVRLDSADALFGVAQYAGDVVVTGMRDTAFVSHDGGATWDRIKGITGGHYPVKVTAADSNFYAYSTGAAFVSRDRGRSWTRLPISGPLAAFRSGAGPLTLINFGYEDVIFSRDEGKTLSALPLRKRTTQWASSIRALAGEIWITKFSGISGLSPI